MYNIQCTLEQSNKKNIIISKIISIEKNRIISPHITFLLPILKREAFQEALYSLTELAANHIIPIITQKIHDTWKHKYSRERSERIIHAAAEQSKNFSFPSLAEPKTLEEVIPLVQDSFSVFFDPEEKPLLPTIQEISKQKSKNIILMIGPEADLTSIEKKFLRQNNFRFCKLTPTILRAKQAAVVSLGSFRTIL